MLAGEGLLLGAGVVLAPAVLMDAYLWIDWWVANETGTLRQVMFNFDAGRLDYYDYTKAEWYLAPEHGVQRSLVGPYVDFNGVNDYIVTATTPVLVDNRFVGVAGADLSVDNIERRLITTRGTLAGTGFAGQLAIVNRADRIVASTSAHHLVGSLLSPAARASHPIPGVPWTLAVIWPDLPVGSSLT